MAKRCEWLAAVAVVASLGPVAAQVPVIDAARLKAQESAKSATGGSKAAKPSTKNATQGAFCNLKKTGGGAGDVGRGTILNQLQSAGDFASLEPSAVTADPTQAVGAAASEAMGTARAVGGKLSGLGQAVTSNVGNLNDVGARAGQDGRYQDSWDRNTGARLQQGQLWNQAISGADAQARVLLENLQSQIVQQSQVTKMLAPDASDPFRAGARPAE